MNASKPHLDWIQHRYIELSKYDYSIWARVFLVTASIVLCTASGAGTGYLFYWLITLRLDFIEVNWWYMVPSMAIGIFLTGLMYFKKFVNTSEHLFNGKERFWQSMFIFESSPDIMIIRITGILGMMLFSYGQIDDFNKEMLAEQQLKELQLQLYQEAKSDTFLYSAYNRYSYLLRDRDGGRNDLAAVAKMDSIERLILRQKAETRTMAESLKVAIATVGPVDNTAMIRFLSRGSSWMYGILILIVVAIIASGIDGGGCIGSETLSKIKAFKTAGRLYAAEIARQESQEGFVKSRQESQEVNVDGFVKERGRVGNSFGIDFQNPKNIAILDAIKNDWQNPGRNGRSVTLKDIGNYPEFRVKKQYVHQVKEAAIEEGLYHG